MFDIGFWEICIIAVMALMVLGPEKLPRVARTAGHWMGRARRFVADVKADISAEMAAEEMQSIRAVGEDLKSVGKDVGSASQDLKQTIDADEDLVAAINESAPVTTVADPEPETPPKRKRKKAATAGKKSTKTSAAKKTSKKKKAKSKAAAKKAKVENGTTTDGVAH